VGFQCQIVSRLPVEKHDCRMDQIISPRTDA
jgi:5-formyltetrahydrofolate cyclo-ligase